MSRIDTKKNQSDSANINWAQNFKSIHEIHRLKKEEEEKDHFDKKEFMEYILNDKDLYNELIVITRDTLTKGKSELKESYAAKDINRINQVAHLLKGHSMTMFFRTLHKISLSIESNMINNDFEGISQQMCNIEKEIDCLIDNYLN